MNYPEWIIPAGVDLDQLRVSTEQLIAEFSRPVERRLRGVGMYAKPRAWRYVGTDHRELKQWRFYRHVIPLTSVCAAKTRLKQPEALSSVLRATAPSADLEDPLLVDPCGAAVSVYDTRALKLAWLKQLKEKIDE